MTSWLQARNLSSIRQNRTLFAQLDFDVDKGDLIQIKGVNGSGKSTLMRYLAGVGQSVAGEIKISDEFVLYDGNIDRAKVLYIGHLPAISTRLTVLENLRFLAQKTGLPFDDQSLFEALRQVELIKFIDQSAMALSAGQKRRIGLARLYLKQGDVKLWLLDEPFTALDLEGVTRLEAQIDLFTKQGGSVVLITHHQFEHNTLKVIQLGHQAQEVFYVDDI
ncbi:MAG: cytochrome c biogenesis heme-transporting ATPase CcmA [Saccharospirillaceae bacterium]|nr:cytochrome c biogenesis heme-transporting ATPase CcmA [Pseudomonadales bacterium]NRB80857.1 cytochrome c biogenesis heme-transporting ATPase CcmA [Saccharospirillaceae bacterium]